MLCSSIGLSYITILLLYDISDFAVNKSCFCTFLIGCRDLLTDLDIGDLLCVLDAGSLPISGEGELIVDSSSSSIAILGDVSKGGDEEDSLWALDFEISNYVVDAEIMSLSDDDKDNVSEVFEETSILVLDQVSMGRLRMKWGMGMKNHTVYMIVIVDSKSLCDKQYQSIV